MWLPLPRLLIDRDEEVSGVRRVRSSWLIALLAVLAIVAAACGGNNKNKGTSSTSTTQAGTVTEGGDVTFAAEQEPDVMDWIDSNAGAAWGNYTVQQATMPRAYDFNVVDGKLAAYGLT